jgi:alkylation response protein AidB-like acyl-CoA dehydrogenase
MADVATVEDTAALLAARLTPRRVAAGAATTSVLGAGAHDDVLLARGRAYLKALADTGLAVPSWPPEHGGLGADAATVAAIGRELAAYEVPDLYPFLIGLAIAGPVVLQYGTPEQQARWLEPIRDGREIWCQLFSEPDAGSDLANLGTRAARDGERWRVTGKKVWTSRGHYARRGLLLARFDPALPKHRGVVAFGIDMESPGVTVRPLRQMNGDAHFNEVFLDDVEVPDTDRIGDVGAGWAVAMTALAFERGAVTGTGSWLDFDALAALARARGALDDARLRQEIAAVYGELRLQALTVRRARDNARSGRPGPEGSGMKLRGSRTYVRYTNLALRLLGADALTPTEPWATLWLTAPSLSIRGGTDEIQRNIVGEHVLGLPGEPRVDRDRPWRDAARGPSAAAANPA